MNVLNNQGKDNASQQQRCASGVQLDIRISAADSSCCESIEADSTQLSGLAAAGSRAFAGANLTLIAKPVALELGLVNGSAVVATGCCGSPSADSFGGGDQRQRVANVYVFDLMPADGVGNQGVRHSDALIEDRDLGSNKDQMSANSSRKRPRGSAEGVLQIIGKPEGHRQASSQDVADCCKDVAADRSKNLNVIHESIIAGNVAGASAGRK